MTLWRGGARKSGRMENMSGIDNQDTPGLRSEVDGRVLEGAGLLFAVFDQEGRLFRFNQGCEAITGLGREEACVGYTWFDLFAPVEQRSAICERMSRLTDGALGEAFECTCSQGRRVEWRLGRVQGKHRPGWVYALGFDVTLERDAFDLSESKARVAALASLTSGLAHELRNPLNAACLTLKVIERYAARSDVRLEMRSAIGQIQSELTRMTSLLEEFLDFARPKPLTLASHDLRAVIGSALDRLGPAAAAAGAVLTFSLAPSVRLLLDRDRVERALECLVDNAITAAGSAGKVDVRLRAGSRTAVVEIWDSGPGLPPNARVFDPFFTTKPQGTGLGLSIVQRTAFDHGGRASVRRRGRHTVFVLELPLRPAPPMVRSAGAA